MTKSIDSQANGEAFSSLPILDLSLADKPSTRPQLLRSLQSALFDVGFLYITNHGIPQHTIDELTDLLPSLFDLPAEVRSSMSKLNSPHFLGYSGFAEEVTLGKHDLREQFDMATELPVVWHDNGSSDGVTNGSCGDRDFSKLFWKLRGPNQWPPKDLIPGFKEAYIQSASP